MKPEHEAALKSICDSAEKLALIAEQLCGKASGGALALVIASKYLEYKAKSEQGPLEYASYLECRDELARLAERHNDDPARSGEAN